VGHDAKALLSNSKCWQLLVGCRPARATIQAPIAPLETICLNPITILLGARSADAILKVLKAIFPKGPRVARKTLYHYLR
jgi:hypothetical protein